MEAQRPDDKVPLESGPKVTSSGSSSLSVEVSLSKTPRHQGMKNSVLDMHQQITHGGHKVLTELSVYSSQRSSQPLILYTVVLTFELRPLSPPPIIQNL